MIKAVKTRMIATACTAAILAGCQSDNTKVDVNNSMGNPANGWTHQIALTSDGDPIIYGLQQDLDVNPVTGFGIIVVKHDANGNEIWRYAPINTGNMSINAIKNSGYLHIDQHDNVLIHYYFNNQFQIVLLDNDGNTLWHNSVTGSILDHSSVKILDGGTYLHKRSSGNSYELTAFDMTGNEIWSVDESIANQNALDVQMETEADKVIIRSDSQITIYDSSGLVIQSLNVGQFGGGRFLHVDSKNNAVATVIHRSGSTEVSVIATDTEFSSYDSTTVPIGPTSASRLDATIDLSDDGSICYSLSSGSNPSIIGAVSDGQSTWQTETERGNSDEQLVAIEAFNDSCVIHTNNYESPSADIFSDKGVVTYSDSYNTQGELTASKFINGFAAASVLTGLSQVYIAGGSEHIPTVSSPLPQSAYYKRSK